MCTKVIDCLFAACSWGVSKVGRIAQHIDAQSNYLYSTFDTSLFSLTGADRDSNAQKLR